MSSVLGGAKPAVDIFVRTCTSVGLVFVFLLKELLMVGESIEHQYDNSASNNFI